MAYDDYFLSNETKLFRNADMVTYSEFEKFLIADVKFKDWYGTIPELFGNEEI